MSDPSKWEALGVLSLDAAGGDDSASARGVEALVPATRPSAALRLSTNNNAQPKKPNREPSKHPQAATGGTDPRFRLVLIGTVGAVSCVFFHNCPSAKIDDLHT